MTDIIMCMLLLAVCTTCGRARSGWTPLGSGIDSVTEALDSGLLHHAGHDSLKRLIGCLEHYAADTADRTSRARVLYFKAQIERDTARGRQLLYTAAALIDSARHPYDYMRIKSLMAGRHEASVVKAFGTLTAALGFWEEAGDSAMMLNDYRELGRIMWDIEEYDRCLDCVEKAMEIARASGYDLQLLSLLNNKAILHQQLGDTAGARQIIRQLDRSPLLMRDRRLYYDFCCNAAYFTGEARYLDTARYIYDPQANPDDAYFVDYLATIFHSGDKAMLDSLDGVLWAHLDSMKSPDMRMNIYETHYRALRRHGDLGGALACFEAWTRLRDSIRETRNPAKVRSLDKRRELEGYERLVEANRRVERMRSLALMGMTGMIAAVIAFTVYTYFRRMKRHSRQQKLEIDRGRLELAASMTTLEGKNRVLESIEEGIRDLETRGVLNRGDAVPINSIIQLHKSGQDEDNAFVESFSRLHPRFFTLMKQRYPSLTPAQLKLAAYLVTGMSSKQICRMLLIQPDAVKKRRYRLRVAMGLQTGDSLEDALREFVENCE